MKKKILAVLLGLTMLAGCGQQVQTVSRPEGISIPSTNAVNAAGAAAGLITSGATENDSNIRQCTVAVSYTDNTNLNKFNIDVLIDGYTLGAVANQNCEIYYVDLEKGEHVIKFVYTDQRESYAEMKFTVDQDNANYIFYVEAKGVRTITTKVTEANKAIYSDKVYTNTICTSLKLSDKYDARTGDDKPINIYVDGKLIGSVESGTTEKLPVQLAEGLHKITFSRTGYEAECISHLITVLKNGKTHNFVCDNYDGDKWCQFTCFYEGSY